ncbi:hypothetical protein OCOL_001162 [Ordospora colligata]|uniref:Uncharacterized protein n=1 Tax=Ordospora colligata OC4 TaxID=1354746 RepID=A0A0B2UHN7_9MICR|nr:uncharacterized protein M896_120470 [Ordospora colligata OC4]KHN68828.1 hypothetical protein M896_120470 [Ordospora colligata OC4]TBU13862.1 hypothetical protein CWI40_120470 [Ordospora colligata]TBU14051.1 hypothetical protein CWI41_120470 [Ordospora colligata]
MKVKAEPCVFFVKGMAAEEEYELVNIQATKPIKKVSGKIGGNRLIVSGNKLFEETMLGTADLDYVDSDEGIFHILTCITRLPPFYNFLMNFGDRCQEKTQCQVLSKILRFFELIKSNKHADVDDILVSADSVEYEDIYTELMKTTHDEMCGLYNFEEDAWNTSKKGQILKSKIIYPEYSPIVEMFQGKAIVNGLQQEVYFEKVGICINESGGVQNAFDLFIESMNWSIIKMPSVLAVVVKEMKNNSGKLDMNLNVGKHLYGLRSFITKRNGASQCYVLSESIWYRYDSSGVCAVPSIGSEVCKHLCMMFYSEYE